MAGDMATWGPQSSTADECSLTCGGAVGCAEERNEGVSLRSRCTLLGACDTWHCLLLLTRQHEVLDEIALVERRLFNILILVIRDAVTILITVSQVLR